MKTTLVFVFALFAVAYARSMTEEGLLSELKDLLKRQVEEEEGSGERPPHPPFGGPGGHGGPGGFKMPGRYNSVTVHDHLVKF